MRPMQCAGSAAEASLLLVELIAESCICSCSGSICEQEAPQHLSGATRKPRSAEVRVHCDPVITTVLVNELPLSEPKHIQKFTQRNISATTAR